MSIKNMIKITFPDRIYQAKEINDLLLFYQSMGYQSAIDLVCLPGRSLIMINAIHSGFYLLDGTPVALLPGDQCKRPLLIM